jgi:hypothetical protein
VIKSITNALRDLINRTACNDFIYRFFWNPIIRFASLAERDRLRFDLDPKFGQSPAINNCAQKLRVQSGPFEGMLYPRAVASGSALTPKLLGAYEAELHETIELLIAYQPQVVFDIGSAEGYYAVGLALRLPEALILAFDIDSVSRKLCAEMASANNVSDRVEIGDLCDQKTLRTLSQVKSVVISDCEGYERRLFDANVAGLLIKTAFLIEMHDFRFPFITRDLKVAFSKTHEIHQFFSVSDICRPQVFKYPALSGLSLADQIAVLAENRPADIWWLLCLPKPEVALDPVSSGPNIV